MVGFQNRDAFSLGADIADHYVVFRNQGAAFFYLQRFSSSPGYTRPDPFMQIEERDLGEHLKASDGECAQRFAGDEERDEDGVERAHHAPRDAFQDTAQMRRLLIFRSPKSNGIPRPLVQVV